jgi:hypothetical protein
MAGHRGASPRIAGRLAEGAIWMTDAADLVELASGLQFPEGPVAMPDGSVVLVEMFGPRITRVQPDGSTETVAEIAGGPNGLAAGVDGALYLCNNGGCFTPVDLEGLTLPGPFDPDRYIGGRIQRVDLTTGAVTDLSATATRCERRTTSCSAPTAGSGSPTTASARSAPGTARGSTTPRLTVR